MRPLVNANDGASRYSSPVRKFNSLRRGKELTRRGVGGHAEMGWTRLERPNLQHSQECDERRIQSNRYFKPGQGVLKEGDVRCWFPMDFTKRSV